MDFICFITIVRKCIKLTELRMNCVLLLCVFLVWLRFWCI